MTIWKSFKAVNAHNSLNNAVGVSDRSSVSCYSPPWTSNGSKRDLFSSSSGALEKLLNQVYHKAAPPPKRSVEGLLLTQQWICWILPVPAQPVRPELELFKYTETGGDGTISGKWRFISCADLVNRNWAIFLEAHSTTRHTRLQHAQDCRTHLLQNEWFCVVRYSLEGLMPLTGSICVQLKQRW